jgi:hypothetical protein
VFAFKLLVLWDDALCLEMDLPMPVPTPMLEEETGTLELVGGALGLMVSCFHLPVDWSERAKLLLLLLL